MSWLPIIALALAAFVIAAFVFRLPKDGWALFGAAVLFGLAGYALQGNPGYASAPKDSAPEVSEANFAMIDGRREFFDPESVPSRFVTVSDAFARKGQYGDAANMLGNAVKENPNDVEAWVALGNALIEHAGGSLTPAALYAYSRAEQLAPTNPGASYFLGIGLLRNGRPGEARSVWADLLAQAPEDASWREQLAERVERLDALIAQMEGPVQQPLLGQDRSQGPAQGPAQGAPQGSAQGSAQ